MSTAESRTRAHRIPAEPIMVVGAGPAGLTCAIALAKGGRTVTVREWHQQAGARFHGDFQGLENWSDERDVLDELRAAGIQTTFEHHAVRAGIAFDADHNRYDVRSERPLYYLVRRGRDSGTLDAALMEQAVAAGAEVRRVDRVQAITGPAVLATGPRRADAIAAGYLFETKMSDGGWVAFDDQLAPLGYAYLLVHGGRGTVASCMFTGFKQEAEHVERTVAFFREHVALDMKNPRPFGGFANFRLPRTAIQGGHPVVGEQAGFQDPLAGFGIRYAIRSGLLAARSILDRTDYAALWRRELRPLLHTGTVNRFIFNSIGPRGRKLALTRLGRGDAGLTLRRLYRPRVLSRILFPVARFRYRTSMRDKSCDHIDCHCVWCQCQSELRAATVARYG